MPQQKLDTYLRLCTQVYDLSKPNPPEDAYAFYRSYALNAKGPILEPMCGTGRFLLPLIDEGFDVQGFDASEHMLEALHGSASFCAKDLRIRYCATFMRSFAQRNALRVMCSVYGC